MEGGGHLNIKWKLMIGVLLMIFLLSVYPLSDCKESDNTITIGKNGNYGLEIEIGEGNLIYSWETTDGFSFVNFNIIPHANDIPSNWKETTTANQKSNSVFLEEGSYTVQWQNINSYNVVVHYKLEYNEPQVEESDNNLIIIIIIWIASVFFLGLIITGIIILYSRIKMKKEKEIDEHKYGHLEEELINKTIKPSFSKPENEIILDYNKWRDEQLSHIPPIKSTRK